MDGESYPALLTQSKVDSAMKANSEKALREYFNKFTKDGGINQIVKWGTIRRNETFILPEVCREDNGKYCLLFDPSRANDNSIILVMKIEYDNNIGYYGKFVNCINLIDLESKNKYKLATPEQIKVLKDAILKYNGIAPDYENIMAICIDPGAGGGGVNAIGDNLLEDWADIKGVLHKGFLDKDYDLYQGYEKKYPNASNILKFYSPQKYRTQMVDEFIELMNLGVIKFPYEYKNDEISFTKKIDDDNEKIITYSISDDESLALMSIDVMKTEITSIYKFENPEKTSKSYALPKDKENKMHDDRFYTAIMLAHYLYELRRGEVINSNNSDYEYCTFIN
jgi:hypothetical protein